MNLEGDVFIFYSIRARPILRLNEVPTWAILLFVIKAQPFILEGGQPFSHGIQGPAILGAIGNYLPLFAGTL
jgi:hypothetical protein